MDEMSEIRLADFENRLRALESGQSDQQGQNAQLPGFVPIPQLTGDTPIPWDLKLDGGELYVFSPIAYVVTAKGKRKSELKIILDGAKEGEWFKVERLYTPFCCVICASVSDSGVVSYSVYTREPSDAIVLFKQVIGTFSMPTGTRPVTGFTQFRRGAPTINGLGIADAASIFLNDNGETEIKGFKAQASETTKLSQHLQAQTEFAGQVLVRTEVNGVKTLLFVPIGNGLGSGGGGGSTAGYTGTIDVPTGNTRCNEESGWYIQNEYATWTFENGLLMSVGSARWPTSGGLATTPLSGT